MAKRPVQFKPTDNISDKPDKKVSYHVFYGACTLLAALLAGLITYVITTNEKQNEKQNSINDRLIHVEAKTDRADSINDRVVRLETQMKFIKSK